jgi:hypothetical protein
MRKTKKKGAIVMANNVNFDNYLKQQLKDPEFKEEFENENTKLERAIASINNCSDRNRS